jgi:hypothetical protein
MTDRAIVDTSSLVPARFRRDLQQAAQLRAFTAIWSPWIIAELNRVLTWRWIKRVDRGYTEADLSAANERRCGEAAKAMMQWLLPTFEVVTPLPPYPRPWDTLTDVWDHPIWAAAKLGAAQYVVSENRRHYPPRGSDGRHIFDGVEYVGAEAFLARLTYEPAADGK